MNADLVLLICFMVFWILTIISALKNHLTWRHRIKAMDMAYSTGQSLIQQGKDYRPVWEIHHSYGTYDQMFFSLNKWTFNQYYPDLEKRLRELTNAQ